ncbi:IS3 family transposase [Aliarcobacter cryaerophilus]|uniref:IS3 family transposase n=1 Tax=Aliarcobacter cryaerophilus TaxID=28198 RepID=UPI0021B64C72|nr:IS3 family transposase [Aliarcobacter cryaerophilus]MCT7406597.1 IS3 family transposase [Aliarcobacter cryaerophilus]MCT7504323.1 IS3 family transposase [Aliarcobacter cryaerophilus]
MNNLLDNFEVEKLEIFKYIELFYNRVRSHRYLNGLSPVEFEEKIEMLHSVTEA